MEGTMAYRYEREKEIEASSGLLELARLIGKGNGNKNDNNHEYDDFF